MFNQKDADQWNEKDLLANGYHKKHYLEIEGREGLNIFQVVEHFPNPFYNIVTEAKQYHVLRFEYQPPLDELRFTTVKDSDGSDTFFLYNDGNVAIHASHCHYTKPMKPEELLQLIDDFESEGRDMYLSRVAYEMATKSEFVDKKYCYGLGL